MTPNSTYKKMALLVFLISGLTSCKTLEPTTSKLTIAQQYYNLLNNPYPDAMASLVSDSIVIREMEANYVERFSREGYVQWSKWDSVFHPTYKVLEIMQERDLVRAKISKIDSRIQFLNEEPMVWNETIRFENHNISQVEHTKYLIFNDSIFVKNRQALVDWIDKNHSELNGFLQDQTIHGGLKYLKALELYKNR